MSKAVLDRVFEPFFTTKEFGSGTGLGLSTSISIVASHRGFIRSYSEVGVGSKFVVYLPALEELQGVEDKGILISKPCGSGEMILIIDDEESIRVMLSEILQSYGYKVCLAGGGAEGVLVYEKNKDQISLVVTDVMMPGMDGHQTARELKKINKDLVIVATSGLSMIADGIGASHFLSKPYTTIELLNTVKDCMLKKLIS